MTAGGESLDRPAFSAAHEHNRRAWNERATKGERFTRPANDADVENFGSKIDLAWCGGSIAGKRVLCLAAGGGRQSALYAAAGAIVTVVDLSGEMLALDRAVAKERGLAIRAVETSMDDLSMFAAGAFDLVVQPVSTCYVPDVTAVYRQVARVITPGGLYISQHKQPASLQCAIDPSAHGYELVEPYYRSGPLPMVAGSLHREHGTLEFLHRWQELLGGLCRSGFVIEDVDEPLHAAAEAESGSFAHRSRYVAPYVRMKARRVGRPGETKHVWTPGH
ncbi:MAG TPA: class I SAM-dependent methyltransferase [Pirellulales bacterium]|nr:class I SAM-dependent methyltransferase [Pirellulales bacterium]